MSLGKYKVWDFVRKKFRSDLLLMQDGKFCAVDNCEIEATEKDDTNFVISFSTGLKDKNGKEIYDGDIIRIPNIRDSSNDWATCELKDYISCVEWKYNMWYVGYGNFHNWCFGKLGDSSNDSSTFEVIGNKFENPELLETDHKKIQIEIGDKYRALKELYYDDINRKWTDMVHEIKTETCFRIFDDDCLTKMYDGAYATSLGHIFKITDDEIRKFFVKIDK